MSYAFTPDDVAYLRSREGTAMLADIASIPFTPASMIADIAAVRARCASHDAALVETVMCRRRARARMRFAESMLFTDDALQQATATPVAAHRAAEIAARHPGAVVADITCSIGAELIELAARPELSGIIGSDLDRVRLTMAQHNVAAAGGQATLLRADALTPTSTADIFLVDPARRAGSGRIFRLDQLAPPLLDVLTVYAGRPIAVKCAPGLDYQLLRDRFGFAGQVQITSLDGSVREACLWTERPGEATRRATVLRSTGDGDIHVEEISDDTDDDVAAGDIGEWIVDPDGAVVRAGLVRNYARRHRLWQLDPQIAYLTGDAVPSGERGFRVLDVVGVADRELRRALAARDCGSLEILVRGLDVDPDKLRKRLKLKGSQPLTLVMTRIGRKGVGIICEAGRRH